MTPEELRDLDRQVAEARGEIACDAWERGNMGSAGGPFLRKVCTEHQECYPSDKVAIRSVFGTVGGGKRYSTDIAAAWALVEEMREAGEIFSVEAVPDGYLVDFDDETHQIDTAPIAICRAFLAWKRAPLVVDSSEGPYVLDSNFAEFRPPSSR